MDKNKTLDDVGLIEDYWQNKISEKYLSTGDLTDDSQVPSSQVRIMSGCNFQCDLNFDFSNKTFRALNFEYQGWNWKA